jgi:hypothetical protein
LAILSAVSFYSTLMHADGSELGIDFNPFAVDIPDSNSSAASHSVHDGSAFLTRHHRRRSSTSDCPPDSIDSPHSHSDHLFLPIRHSRARTEHPTTNYHHPLRNIDLAPDLDDTGVTRPRLNRLVNEASSSSSADEETGERIVSPLRLVSPSASSSSSQLKNERLVLVHEVGVSSISPIRCSLYVLDRFHPQTLFPASLSNTA